MKTSNPGNIIALLDLDKVNVLSKIKYLIKISHKLLLPAQLRSCFFQCFQWWNKF